MIRSAVDGVEAVEAWSGRAFARHTHDRFGIGIISRGAQRSLSGRGMVEAGPGDVITVNPGEVHDGMPLGGDARAWSMLYLDPALVADAAGDVRPGLPADFEFAAPVISDPAVAGRVRALFSAVTVAGAPRLPVEEALASLMSSVMGVRDEGPGRRRAPAAIARVRDLIDDDPSAPLTLSDLARESGLGRFQVLRAFVASTGLTPHAYLVQRRIDLARRLIARGTPLAEAAVASGFADQSHMTRVFVRRYGVSPGAYAGAVG